MNKIATPILSSKNPIKVVYINIAEEEYRVTIERVIHSDSIFTVVYGDYYIFIEKKKLYKTLFGKFKTKYQYVTDGWCNNNIIEEIYKILDSYLLTQETFDENQSKKEEIYKEEFCQIENEGKY